MYGNLFKELKQRNVTQTDIAKFLGLSNQSVNQKVKGLNEFKSTEMFAIKEHFFPDLTLEYLFEKN